MEGGGSVDTHRLQERQFGDGSLIDKVDEGLTVAVSPRHASKTPGA